MIENTQDIQTIRILSIVRDLLQSAKNMAEAKKIVGKNRMDFDDFFAKVNSLELNRFTKSAMIHEAMDKIVRKAMMAGQPWRNELAKKLDLVLIPSSVVLLVRFMESQLENKENGREAQIAKIKEAKTRYRETRGLMLAAN